MNNDCSLEEEIASARRIEVMEVKHKTSQISDSGLCNNRLIQTIHLFT